MVCLPLQGHCNSVVCCRFGVCGRDHPVRERRPLLQDVPAVVMRTVRAFGGPGFHHLVFHRNFCCLHVLASPVALRWHAKSLPSWSCLDPFAWPAGWCCVFSLAVLCAKYLSGSWCWPVVLCWRHLDCLFKERGGGSLSLFFLFWFVECNELIYHSFHSSHGNNFSLFQITSCFLFF